MSLDKKTLAMEFMACLNKETITKKERNAHKTPTGIRLTSLDSITYTPSHKLSAVSLTCYNSRITVQNNTMQLPIAQMVHPNLMSHNTKPLGLWP
jgi:hypothetical protein